MTTEQALHILDQAAAIAPLSRQDHVAVQEALVKLRQAFNGQVNPIGTKEVEDQFPIEEKNQE